MSILRCFSDSFLTGCGLFFDIGNSFYNFLTKGSVPFKVPIPDTLTIGYGSGSSASSTVKLLTYDYRKDCLVTHTAQFDNQDQRDTFFNLCFDKFMIPQTYTYRQEEKDGFSGKNLTKAKVPGGGEGDKEGPEDDQKNTKKVQSDVPNHLKEDYFENAPLFNRFVGIQKKPVTMSRFQGSSGGNGDVAVNVRPSSAKQKKHIMKGTSSSNNRERTVAASTAGKRYNRAYTHQHCETVLSFALHALLLELADRSKSEHNSDSDGFSPYIIQRFVKSRGKRPSIYRIFWKNGGASSLLAEGWNIAKAEEEFVLPDLVLRNSTQVNLSNSPEREGTTAAGDKHNPNFEPQHRFGHNEDNIVQKDEFNFQKTTTKFITNLLFMGKRKKEQEALELKEKELAKAVVQNLAPQTNSMPFSHTNKSAKVNKIPIQVAQASPTLTTATTQLPFVSQPPTPSKKPLGGKPAMQRQDSSFTFNSDVIDNTFLTSNPNQASSSNPKNSAPLKSAMKGAVTTTTAATTSSAADVATTAFSNQNGESPLKKKVLDFLDNISTPELDE